MSEASPPTPDATPEPIATPTPAPDTTSPTPQPEPSAKPSVLNEPEPGAPEPAPEKYADFKLPDGVTLDAAALTKARDLFKGLGLSQAAAQSLVDFHTGQLAAIADAPVKAYNDTVEAWGQQLKADPEVGAKLTEVKANLGRAYDVLINAVPEKAAETRALVNEFKSMMDLTGAGNHPAFVKVFNRLALAVIEPGHVSGKAPVSPNATGAVGSGNPGLAASMYPKNAS